MVKPLTLIFHVNFSFRCTNTQSQFIGKEMESKRNHWILCCFYASCKNLRLFERVSVSLLD